MRTLRAIALFVFAFMSLGLAACGPAPLGDAVAPVGQLSKTVAPQSYALDLKIDPQSEVFSGKAVIDVVLKERGRRLFMHGAGLHVSSVYLETAEGARVRARYREVVSTGVAQIDLERAAGPGAAKLVFEYSARFNENLAGLYRVEQGGLWYAMTQFEPVDARRAFPSFDEPAFKTPFKISITAPAGLAVVSNSPETKTEVVKGGWERHEFAETPPLPTYLIAMAVGPYEVVQAASIPANGVRRTALPLRGIATKGKGAQLEYALGHIAPILNALESYFGTPYPFAKLDVMAAPDFEAGAMENAGLVTFREPLLLLSDTAGISRKRDFLLGMAHELSHQWFGNLVTPQWWDDIWLNEAFASWMEAKIANQVDPSGDYMRGIQRDAMGAMQLDGLSDVRRVREPILRTEDVEDAFDSITYQKGAAVLAMFERYLGEAAFRDGVRRHMERFAHDSATADDFFQSLAQGAQRPEVVPAFKSFVDRPGVPVVGAEGDCTDLLSGPQIVMRQGRYAPLGSKITVGEPWIIPACFAGLSDRGRQETCVLLDRLEQNTPIPSCPKAVIPNVGGLGYYRLALNSENAETLLGLRGAMSPGEVLALTESLDAAYRAGTLDGVSYLKGMRSAAASPLWDVAAFPAGYYTRYGAKGALESMVESVAPEARADFATVIRAMYAPRLQGALAARDDAGALLRKAAVQAVALQGNDPVLRQSLIDSVLPVLGFPAPEAGAPPLDEDLRETALIVAIQDRGKPVLDAVFIALKTATDQSFRRDAVEALGEVQDRVLIDQVLRLALGADFSGAESYDLVSVLMSNPAAQDVTWVWLKKNYSAFAQRIPESRKAEAPSLTRRMCSADTAADVERFFQKNATNYKPSRRIIAMSVEEIQLCASLRRARNADLKSALAAAAADIRGGGVGADLPPASALRPQTAKPKPAAKASGPAGGQPLAPSEESAATP